MGKIAQPSETILTSLVYDHRGFNINSFGISVNGDGIWIDKIAPWNPGHWNFSFADGSVSSYAHAGRQDIVDYYMTLHPRNPFRQEVAALMPKQPRTAAFQKALEKCLVSALAATVAHGMVSTSRHYADYWHQVEDLAASQPGVQGKVRIPQAAIQESRHAVRVKTAATNEINGL